MRSFLIQGLIIICGYCMAISQEVSADRPFQNPIVTFNTLSLVNPSPRIRVGYVQPLHEHWWASIDVGFGTQALSFFDLDQDPDRYTLWEFRPEIYHIVTPERKHPFYVSVEYFWILDRRRLSNRVCLCADGEYSFDSARLRRRKHGAHFKFGWMFSIDRVGLNLYGGLGRRQRKNQFTEIVNPVEDFVEGRYGDLGTFTQEGTSSYLNPSLGLKLTFEIGSQ